LKNSTKIRRAALAFAIMASITGAATAVEIRGPSPDHVWEASDDGKWAGLGRPETDDVVLTLSCETPRKVDVVLFDYAPMPDGKEGDGGVASAVLRRPGMEVSVVGMLRENTMNGTYDLSFQQGVEHPLIEFLKGDGMAEIEVDEQYQNKTAGGHRSWISLKGAKRAVEKLQARCSGATPATSSRAEWNAASQAQVGKAPAARAKANDDFQYYPAYSGHRGKVTLPNFTGRDRDWSTFRTRIRNGMKDGANFAGHLAIVEIGCGTSCIFAPVGDVGTGQVHRFPLGGEEYMSLTLKYRRDSRLVVAHWIDGGRCMREYVEWTGNGFREFGKGDIGTDETCWAMMREEG
jgi:hypothetical protein